MKDEALKLMRTLHKVEQGFLYSAKYSRLFDSFISSVAIHEASHAVIATMLGERVACAQIEIEREKVDGAESITSGVMIPAEGEVDRLLKDRQGRVTYTACILASRLTKDFKFEWQVEEHLVESGFDSDNSQLAALNDGSIIEEAAALLAYLFTTYAVIYIEAVAKVLNEKKVIYGSEIRKIVDTPPRSLSFGVFTQKDESSWKFPNGRVVLAERGMNLQEYGPCNRYPISFGGLDSFDIVFFLQGVANE